MPSPLAHLLAGTVAESAFGSFWISPEGEFHRIGSDQHEDWAADMIVDPTTLAEWQEWWPQWDGDDTVDQEMIRGAIFNDAYTQGWVDAALEHGTLYLRTPPKSRRQRSAIRDWMIEQGVERLEVDRV